MARLIDADAFKAYIMDGIADHEDIPPSQFPIVEAAAKGFLLDIYEQPTISPDEVRGVGEWIWHDNYGWDDSLECSCCAEEFFVYDGEFPGIDSFKFCPNCGARMKGVSEDA